MKNLPEYMIINMEYGNLEGFPTVFVLHLLFIKLFLK
jgi:hypothetical protein